MLRKNLSWETSLDEIHLKQLAIDCTVGIYPHEKNTPQKLLIDLTLYLDTRKAAQANCLTKSVDYAALRGEINFLFQNTHFQLIETAAEALAHYVLAPPPSDKPRGSILGVEILIHKPDAFEDETVPAIKIRRHRSEVLGHFEDFDFGEAYVIHKNKDNWIYRITVPAFQHSPYYCQTTPKSAAEMPLSKGLVAGGKTLEAGVALSYPQGFYRRYHNNTDQDKTLLCVAPSGTLFDSDEASAIACDKSSLRQATSTAYYETSTSQDHF